MDMAQVMSAASRDMRESVNDVMKLFNEVDKTQQLLLSVDPIVRRAIEGLVETVEKNEGEAR